jgi:hypothetical protein
MPTPIGAPPGPPTPVLKATATSGPATATPVPTGTPGTATPTGTAVAGATTTPTVATSAELSFSLDAARVSRVNNPGNFQGLAAVRPGSRVWLMMYYTITNLPKSLQRTTTYDILAGSKRIFSVTYRDSEKRQDRGRFSRYTVYSVPSGLPFGKYRFRATLKLGKSSATRTWGFAVAAHERVASNSTRP